MRLMPCTLYSKSENIGACYIIENLDKIRREAQAAQAEDVDARANGVGSWSALFVQILAKSFSTM